jgi:hypothetical protein
MSDETTRSTADEAPEEPGAADAAAEQSQAERVDEDGLPLDREPTFDDVRSKEGQHGRIAFGCALAIVLVLLIFWLVRGGMIG